MSLKPYFIRYLDKCPATPDKTETYIYIYIPCIQVHVAILYVCGKFIMLRLNACYDLHKYYDKKETKSGKERKTP